MVYNKKMNSIIYKIILIINIIALLLSIYLFVEFEILKQDNPYFCDINKLIDCNKVNSSSYAYFLNIPFSFWGIIYFSILLIMLWQEKKIKKILFFYALIGSLFLPYFIYAEIKLKAICSLCLIINIILAINPIAIWKLNKKIN